MQAIVGPSEDEKLSTFPISMSSSFEENSDPESPSGTSFKLVFNVQKNFIIVQKALHLCTGLWVLTSLSRHCNCRVVCISRVSCILQCKLPFTKPYKLADQTAF